MAFTVPSFNLAVDVWNGPVGTGTYRFSTMGNLQHARRMNIGQPILTGPDLAQGAMYLLLTKYEDVRDNFSVEGSDLVEVPALSGRWYQVIVVDDVAKGFANEFRCAIIMKSLGPSGESWPTPIP